MSKPTPHIVLAEYFVTDDSTFLFIVRTDDEEPDVVEIKTSMSEIRQFATTNFGAGSRKVRDLEVHTWQARFDPFIAPLAACTKPGDIVWLVPHDALHYLPLHALKLEGQYFIERNPICYTPSASVMKYCHAKRKGRRQTAFVLGDSRDNLFPARVEALAVATLFGTTPFVGKQATKATVRAQLEQARDTIDILHFACHGYFDPLQPLKSGIVLAPERADTENPADDLQSNLTAEEIFGLELHADLVTLSACETGVNERQPGDELIGLTRALIYAGTPSVVVSLWRVNGLSSQMLMQQFYTRLQGGAIKVEALQQAQIGLLNTTYAEVHAYVEGLRTMIKEHQPNDETQLVRDLNLNLLALEAGKPAGMVGDDWFPFVRLYHWAPFVLVGDWQ